MWCIGTLTEEYRRRMYNLLALYARPLRCDEPVICINEKSLQLLAHSREPLPMGPGARAKQDCEYVPARCCAGCIATTHRSTQVGSTWQRSRSASSAANA